jgi:hypothetical protein
MDPVCFTATASSSQKEKKTRQNKTTRLWPEPLASPLATNTHSTGELSRSFSVLTNSTILMIKINFGFGGVDHSVLYEFNRSDQGRKCELTWRLWQ